MPVSKADVAVGRCFVTSTSQVRKVIKIDGEEVRYVSRGRKPMPGWDSGHHTDVEIEKSLP